MSKTLELPISYLMLSIGLMLPGTASAACVLDIVGTWQQTHVVFQGHKINDASQSWEFGADRAVRFRKTTPKIDVSGTYSCDGDVIHMHGKSAGRLQIVEHTDKTMAWKSLDHGGGITHVVKAR